MSLTSALHTTYAGLSKTESQMSVVSSNVTNADKAGYTVKTYQSEYTTANGITVPISGTVVGSLDTELYEDVIDSYTEVGYTKTMAEYLENYIDTIGSTDGDDTLSAYMDELKAAMSSLETSPSDSSTKVDVVSNAESAANELNSLSETVQDLRLRADQEIETCVAEINDLLDQMDSLNEQMAVLTANASSTADTEDERMVALAELAEYLDIRYYINDSNQVKVFTTSGTTLLDSTAHELAYNASTSVTSSSTFSGITISGRDITSTIKSGEIAALLELRDETLVNEQEKLNALANTLSQTVNAVFNEGTSYPACSELTSDVDGLTLADAFSATGLVRIAVVDEEGVVQSYADLDLSACATVGAVVTAISSIAGVTASLDTNGKLVVTADNTGEGISMNQMDSDVGADSETFSMYFGFNNIFTGEGAERIRITDHLQSSGEYLASGMLSNDAALAVGDSGILAADGTIATAAYGALDSSSSFVAAGDFVAQSATLSTYANKIIAAVANASENATKEYNTAYALYNELKTTMENKTGVNIDEETAKMVELESQYQASATVLATILEMLDALMAAMR